MKNKEGEGGQRQFTQCEKIMMHLVGFGFHKANEFIKEEELLYIKPIKKVKDSKPLKLLNQQMDIKEGKKLSTIQLIWYQF